MEKFKVSKIDRFHKLVGCMHEGEWGSIHEGNSRNLYNRGVSETRTKLRTHYKAMLIPNNCVARTINILVTDFDTAAAGRTRKYAPTFQLFINFSQDYHKWSLLLQMSCHCL